MRSHFKTSLYHSLFLIIFLLIPYVQARLRRCWSAQPLGYCKRACQAHHGPDQHNTAARFALIHPIQITETFRHACTVLRKGTDSFKTHTTIKLLWPYYEDSFFITLHVHACRKRKNISFIKKVGTP